MNRRALGCMAVGCLLIPVVTALLIVNLINRGRLPGRVRRPSGTALSIPPADRVRILPRKIADTPARAEWQWTVVGDRNWTTARANAGTLVLGGAYPFNSRQRLGGTNVWVVTVSVSKQRDANPGQLRVDSSLHGSNGTSVASGLSVAAGAGGLLSPEVTRDTLAHVPTELTLARAGPSRIAIKLEP